MAKQELTEMQRKFAEYYVQTGNATQSAVLAGYSKDTASSQGSRLLNNVKVKKLIVEIRQEEGEEYDMDLEMVKEELTKIIQDPKTKAHYKIEAMQMMARLKGWMKADTKIEITNNTTQIEQISDEELQKRMNELLGNQPNIKRVK